MRNKKGQVWIETVLYTLIGISLIGLVLAFITPKINDAKDRAVVEQTINSLSAFDEKMNAAFEITWSRRVLDFTIKRGSLYIDAEKDEIIFEVDDLSKPYSELGANITLGRITITSLRNQKTSSAILRLNYAERINITYDGLDNKNEKFTPAATPYRFSLENVGIHNGLTAIDITEITGR